MEIWNMDVKKIKITVSSPEEQKKAFWEAVKNEVVLKPKDDPRFEEVFENEVR